jgi:hypothetical protein
MGDVPLPHTRLPVARFVKPDAAERVVAVEPGEVLISFSWPCMAPFVERLVLILHLMELRAHHRQTAF